MEAELIRFSVMQDKKPPINIENKITLKNVDDTEKNPFKEHLKCDNGHNGTMTLKICLMLDKGIKCYDEPTTE